MPPETYSIAFIVIVMIAGYAAFRSASGTLRIVSLAAGLVALLAVAANGLIAGERNDVVFGLCGVMAYLIMWRRVATVHS